jgi:hypothetical protein
VNIDDSRGSGIAAVALAFLLISEEVVPGGFALGSFLWVFRAFARGERGVVGRYGGPLAPALSLIADKRKSQTALLLCSRELKQWDYRPD